MKLISKIIQFFNFVPKLDYIEYNNNLEKELQEYFSNRIEYSDYILDKFLPYILYKCKLKGLYPTRYEISKYLKKEISFDQIRSKWQEFEQSNQTAEDYNRIIINGCHY